MRIEIRDATVADARSIAVVHVAAWRSGYAGLMPADYLASLSVTERARRWRRSLGDPAQPTEVLVASDLDRDELLGIAVVGPSRDDDAPSGTGELWAINLDPSAWGRGVAGPLHDVALERLRRRPAPEPFRRATLWVLDGNGRAQRFYERHGWAPDGHTKVEQEDGFELSEVRYGRPL